MRVCLIFSFSYVSHLAFAFYLHCLPAANLVRGRTCTRRFHCLDYIAARTNPAVANTPEKRNMKRRFPWCGGKEAPWLHV